MDIWEYNTIKIDLTGFMGGILDTDEFTAELNNQGTQGWELVSCFSTNQGNGTGREAIAVLKRKSANYQM